MTRDDQLRQALSRPWRQGHTVPRNIYAVSPLDDAAEAQDIDIGRMDTAALAKEVVEAHNAMLAATFERDG